MSRRAAGWILATAALLLVLGSLAWWWQSGRGGGRAERRGSGESAAAGASAERHAFELYFPAGAGGLRAERRELLVSEGPKDRMRKVIEALLVGPAGAGGATLVRPFPPEVKLGSVQLAADGTAFVDLRWPDHEDPPESGSTEEIQRVYSVVDSLALNVPQVSRVVLLWNGTQRITFGGHLDTSRPLLPDRSLLLP
jgi:hypothetical protein